MSEQKANPTPPQVQAAPAPRPAIPPREPKGEADWLVLVRHSPLLPATLSDGKGLVVRATSKGDAWKKFLAEAEDRLRSQERQYARDPGTYGRAQDWLRQAKLEIPDGAEIIGVEYVEARKRALRVKGTMTVEQIGFPELASV